MVRIITERPIFDFIGKHPQYAGPVKAWMSIVKDTNTIWHTPKCIVDTFGPKAVDIIGDERVVIDIKGNKIRVIAKYQFPTARLYLKWIGTHADYDKLCKKDLQYTIEPQ